jgi:hypothetical protein
MGVNPGWHGSGGLRRTGHLSPIAYTWLENVTVTM